MHPRASDFLGAAILAIVLVALVAILVAGNVPPPPA
jgi:hypothetical protein